MERINLFDRYINGELSEEENRTFKERLESDDDFVLDFRIYSLSIVGICKEAEQDNADFGSALKRITKEQLFDIIGRKEKPVCQEEIINRLQSRIVLNRAQRTELHGAAALNDIDDDDYSEDESEHTDKKKSDNEKQGNSGNSLQRFTLIFIFIIILLIIISILM